MGKTVGFQEIKTEEEEDENGVPLPPSERRPSKIKRAASFTKISQDRLGTLRRRLSSVLSTAPPSTPKTAEDSETKKTLCHKEWIILVIIEMLLNYCEYCLSSFSAFEYLGVKNINISTDIYVSRFIGGFGGVIVGFVADSYTGHYPLALLSAFFVWATSAAYMGFREALRHAPEYAHPTYKAINYQLTRWAAGVFKSFEFTRMTYGLLKVKSEKRSHVELFLVMMLWSGPRIASGGWLFTVLDPTKSVDDLMTTFIFSGFSVLVFTYVLTPEERSRENYNIVGKVIHEIIAAIRNKNAHHDKHKKKRHEHSSTHYREITNSFFTLCIKLIPAYGILLTVAVVKCNIMTPISDKVVPTMLEDKLGVAISWNIFTLFSVFLGHFTFKLLRIDIQWKYVIGYGSAALYILLCTAFYFVVDGGVVVHGNLGGLWLFNARDNQVIVAVPEGKDWPQKRLTIQGKKSVYIYYPHRGPLITKINVTFLQTKLVHENQTILFDVRSNELSGYFLYDPPALVKIPGLIPIRMGPPLIHKMLQASFFLFNAVKPLANETLIFSNDEIGVKKIVVDFGRTLRFQLQPGDYHLKVSKSELRSSINVGHGGTYGIIITNSKEKDGMFIRQIIPSNTLPGITIASMGLLYGLSLALALVYIQTATYLSSPRYLLGTAFNFINLLETLGIGFCIIGWKTWHVNMSGLGLSVYFYLVSAGFLVNLYFQFSKFNKYSI